MNTKQQLVRLGELAGAVTAFEMLDDTMEIIPEFLEKEQLEKFLFARESIKALGKELQAEYGKLEKDLGIIDEDGNLSKEVIFG